MSGDSESGLSSPKTPGVALAPGSTGARITVTGLALFKNKFHRLQSLCARWGLGLDNCAKDILLMLI